MPKVEKKDPYKVLDISRNSTEGDIKAAYKKMALQWHPDRHISGKENAAQKFIEGNDAYRTLVDEKRKQRRSKKSGETSKGPANESTSVHSDSRSSASNGDAGSSSHQSNAGGSHATHTTHATHASPASSNKDDKDLSPVESPRRSNSNPSAHSVSHSDHHSGGSRRSSGSSAHHSSGSKKAPSEPKSDNISTRSKDGGVNIEPSSPQPTHRSMSAHASENNHSDTPLHPSPQLTHRSTSSHASHESHSDNPSHPPQPTHRSTSSHASHKSHSNTHSDSSPQPIHRPTSSQASDNNHSDTPLHPPQQTSVNKSQKSSPKSSGSKLHKKRKAASGSPNDVDSDSVHLSSTESDIADEPFLKDYVHIRKTSDIPTEENGHGMSNIPVDEEGNLEPALRPIETPVSSSKEWMFPLELTLEELYNGTSLRFRITRRLLSRRTKQTMVAIDIPSGTLAGTKIRCPGVGHQRRDTTFQDVVFVVEEKPHDRFTRIKDDLFLDVFVPYVDQLAEDGGDICLDGIGEEDITINIPYPINQKSTDGEVIVKGAGMPSRKGGRGNLVVRWQVVFPSTTSKWGLFKRVFHMHH